MCDKTGRQRRQNAWPSDSSSHSSSVSSGHDLDAWKHAEILAQGQKITRHWPKKGMFKSCEYFRPVYQTESSAFPNRAFSFHASIFYITCTEKITENVLEGSTVYCSRETIHFYALISTSIPQPAPEALWCCYHEHEELVTEVASQLYCIIFLLGFLR